MCGTQAGDTTVLGDPVAWRVLALSRGSLTLTEWSRGATRTAEELLAAGFTAVAGAKSPTYGRVDGERQLRVTLNSCGSPKLDTTCKAPEGGISTAEMERNGWFPASVHRRIGRGLVVAAQISDGDEHYVRTQFSTVEARSDTTGLVDAGDGAYRNAPGAEPESLVLLRDDPLTVEFRTGSAFLVDNGIEVHKATRAR